MYQQICKVRKIICFCRWWRFRNHKMRFHFSIWVYKLVLSMEYSISLSIWNNSDLWNVFCWWIFFQTKQRHVINTVVCHFPGKLRLNHEGHAWYMLSHFSPKKIHAVSCYLFSLRCFSQMQFKDWRLFWIANKPELIRLRACLKYKY